MMKVLTKLGEATASENDDDKSVWRVTPEAAFCVKFRGARLPLSSATCKLFLNVCTCHQLPKPATDVDEEGLAALLDSPNATSYRIPLSVGELRQISDHSNEPCVAVDLLINSSFYSDKVQKSELFANYLIVVAVQAVEAKHKVVLGPDAYSILRNRKCMGELGVQTIRRQAADNKLVIEVGEELASPTSEISLVTEPQAVTKEFTVEPKYKLIKKLDSMGRRHIDGSFELPDVEDANSMDLQVGEDRIMLKALPYHLDIFLPVKMNSEMTEATFDVDKRVLSVTMPCSEV